MSDMYIIPRPDSDISHLKSKKSGDRKTRPVTGSTRLSRRSPDSKLNNLRSKSVFEN